MILTWVQNIKYLFATLILGKKKKTSVANSETQFERGPECKRNFLAFISLWIEPHLPDSKLSNCILRHFIFCPTYHWPYSTNFIASSFFPSFLYLQSPFLKDLDPKSFFFQFKHIHSISALLIHPPHHDAVMLSACQPPSTFWNLFWPLQWSDNLWIYRLQINRLFPTFVSYLLPQ